MRCITLTTDFGLADWFVGTMRGVILSICPGATIVDITHEIPAGDVRAGAFALAASYRYFPKHTVHLAVVDPGVGSQRPAIAVTTREGVFLGPNNGVLSFALRHESICGARLITNQRLFVQPVSRTFHGRDIFAPVAARLSAGLAFHRVGPTTDEFARLAWPTPRRSATTIQGEVIHLDRFGNGITNIPSAWLPRLDPSDWWIEAGRGRRVPLGECYQSVKAGKPVGIPGSSGFLEIALNGGSAADVLKLRRGEPVRVGTR